MTKVSIKAVLLGGITDVVATNIASIPLLMTVMKTIDRAHLSKDQTQAAVIAAIHSSPALFSAQFLVGTACSVLGGYVAAYLARRNELLNGALAAWL
ncbi:MAG: hypothetical protein P4L83_24965 [Nevskia sp.]|nr:hypothetical protein [Nevskia sp.]